MEELLLHQVEVHQQWEEVLHLQEEALQLIEEVLILIIILRIEEQLLIQIIEHQTHQVAIQGHHLRILEVVLHLQEVLVQDLHLGEEINLIFLRKFQ